MVDAKKCDRCGMFYNENEKTFKINRTTVSRIDIHKSTDSRSIVSYDLCDNCVMNLVDWLCKFGRISNMGEASNQEATDENNQDADTPWLM